ncbi:PAS domain S-box protein [Mucilaginibacter auburnensis]|uniref:PAS domain S-box-containing protein n=1 Tax=Mucilaginibacter auburnensis TaxID=1457233 RepID=A0A2H9VP04_9SPHI|nr:PAS domain S-box protein [Mucilaginibacter auburnensis]PJJ80074.1 PAS domain S-box-containing protein [Mucilaginibacter auburnensis]
MKQFLQRYINFTQKKLIVSLDSNEQDLRYWQNLLFCKFLVYCLPVSLIALLPTIFIVVKDGFPLITGIVLTGFGLLATVTFIPNITLRQRKIITLFAFYIVATFLVGTSGFLWPGIFYLFFITVLSGLIFPIRIAYGAVLTNALILIAFALVIGLKLFDSPLIAKYSVVKWVASSANLMFVSVIIVMLIDKIFEGLQLTIANKTQLQERYQHIFQKSPSAMWLFDTENFSFIDVNEAAIRQYGYSRDEFLSMTIMDIRPAENIDQTARLVQTNRNTGKFYEGSWQHKKKNGELIFVKIESNLLSLDNRQVRFVQATDITTQIEHQLEVFNYHKKIEESEANLRAIFDSAVDGFVLVDADGIIKLFNPKASASMEFNKDQMSFEIGRSIFDYVEAARLAYFKRIMEKVYRGETVDYERMFSFDDNVVWIRYTINPVLENNKIVGACIMGRDITERKFYLQSLEEQNKTFREISWMQSHMVRAPLARMLGLLPMLSTEISDEDRKKVIEYLNISANELDDVVNIITDRSTAITDKDPQNAPKNRNLN